MGERRLTKKLQGSAELPRFSHHTMFRFFAYRHSLSHQTLFSLHIRKRYLPYVTIGWSRQFKLVRFFIMLPNLKIQKARNSAAVFRLVLLLATQKLAVHNTLCLPPRNRSYSLTFFLNFVGFLRSLAGRLPRLRIIRPNWSHP